MYQFNSTVTEGPFQSFSKIKVLIVQSKNFLLVARQTGEEFEMVVEYYNKKLV